MFSAKPKILCVDDEPSNLKLLEAVIVPRGYEVVKAGSGREALEKIKEQKIDLVLLDVMMPEINGFEVCRMIKGDKRFNSIPVVMITSLRSKEDRIRGIETGAEDFISKPFDHGEILARIKMLLKIKDLNDRLSLAYDNINYLTYFGEKMIESFDPMNFDFMSSINRVVSQTIRPKDEMVEKPQMVIAYIPDERNRCHWFKYESLSQELNRTQLELDYDCYSQYLPGEGISRIAFYNEAEIPDSEDNRFIEKLKSINIPVSNIVSYISKDFCIFSLNYGRSVTEYDASVLNSLVMHSLFLK